MCIQYVVCMLTLSFTLVDSNDRNMVMPLNKNISMALSYIMHTMTKTRGSGYTPLVSIISDVHTSTTSSWSHDNNALSLSHGSNWTSLNLTQRSHTSVTTYCGYTAVVQWLVIMEQEQMISWVEITQSHTYICSVEPASWDQPEVIVKVS